MPADMEVPGTDDGLIMQPIRDYSLGLSILLISAATLAYEVLLMRWFSIIQWHHFAFMIISLALLGFGASGCLLSLFSGGLRKHFASFYPGCLLGFAISVIAATVSAQNISFNPELLLWDWRQTFHLLATYLILMLPFLFAAAGVGLSLMMLPGQISGLYAANLIGSAIGSIGIVILLFYVFPETALYLVSGAGIVAAGIGWWAVNRTSMGCFAAVAATGLCLYLIPDSWTRPLYSEYKSLIQTLRIPGNRIVNESSSPLGRISVVASKTTPFRHAPGLSLNATTEIPKQIGVFIDGDQFSVINQNNQADRQDWLDQTISALPYHLKTMQQVLVAEAGTGTDVLLAQYHQARQIEALEINPAIVDLVQHRYAGFTKGLYRGGNTKLTIDDSRNFAETRKQVYDLITLTQPGSSASAGLQGLGENYLYTVEGLTAMLNRLAQDGYLAITLQTQFPPRASLKLFAMAIEALNAHNVQSPEHQLIFVRSWQSGILLVKNGIFTKQEIDRALTFCTVRNFDPVYFSGIQPQQSNRRNRVREDYFYLGSQILLTERAESFQTDYKFNILPATDDHPYFFSFFKWQTLPEIVSALGSGGISLFESGHLVLSLTLVQALLASSLFILLPLHLAKGPTDRPIPKPFQAKVFGFFFVLGAAFMMLEISLIQKCILLLHQPLYAVTTVLSVILLGAGLGSLWSQRFDPGKGALDATRYSILAIVFIAICYMVLHSQGIKELMSLPQIPKTAIAGLLVFPLGFFMGLPFPLGLGAVTENSPSMIPWAWAINGCASVVSSVLAALISVQYGFTLLISLSLVLYTIAAFIFPR